MKKPAAASAVLLLSGILAAGCAGNSNVSNSGSPVQSPAATAGASASPSAAPSPAPEKTPAGSAKPSASPSASAAPGASPAPSSAVKASPSAAPSAAPSAKPSASPGAAKPSAQPKGESGASRQALSWYYMKKPKGQVPDFPKETKSFTAKEKAVWVGQGKNVYLTIDNGGPMGDTAKLLKTLKENNVKANFFISGNNVKAHPDFIKQLAADGHLVANHTMTHKDMNTLSDEQVRKEITDFEKLYKSITGQDVVKYFRFPYGKYSTHLLDLTSDMGYTSVFWSTAMRDWEPRANGAEDPYNDIMNNLHPGNIILMHQGSKENMEALDRILKDVKKAGYSFGLVSEIKR
ncbi:delta-lactam-biosynthetic de-N-acetylase [Paenibacillus chitinolyticus]